MIIFKEAASLTKYIQRQKQAQAKIGFVPTMGALHEGHLSLVERCAKQADVTVSSIFVNPTQFNDPKDYNKYPSTINEDIYLLQQRHCDVLFLPSVEEVYPDGLASAMHYSLGELENVLEGRYRPGHFQGVCQVVHRLLNIVMPDYLFLGQKDYQQALVLKRLVEILNLPVEVITSETYREPTGLAMSSRNLRLSKEEKEKATAIFEALTYMRNNYSTNQAIQLEKYATDYLLSKGFSKVDYVSIADAETLHTISNVNAKALALIAAYMGEVRLIDNMMLK